MHNNCALGRWWNIGVSLARVGVSELARLGLEDLRGSGVVDFLREECRQDFFFFVRVVLNPLVPADEFGVRKFGWTGARHFRQMMRLIEGDAYFDLYDFGRYNLATKNPQHNRKMIIVPRIHGKSTVMDVAFLMWLLYKNPNLRILLGSEIWENARDMLRMIKTLYLKIRECQNTENVMIWLIMGDWIGDLWNEDKIIVKKRTIPDKTPSISTCGLFSEITSQHYDVVLGDDFIGKENTTTLEQIENANRRIGALTEVGDYDRFRQTLFLFLGTPWHYADFYCGVRETLKEYFDFLWLKCWDEDHNPLFPEKYTREALETIKAQKMITNPNEWFLQWECDPMPEAEAPFLREWFQVYHELPKKLDVYICVDTALSENKWSCDTAIVPVGVDNQNRRFVLPYWSFKEKRPHIIANELIRIANYHRQQLRVIGIEEGTLYNALYPILIYKAPGLPIMPLKINNRSKDMRIWGVQPLARNKLIYIQQNMFDFVEQFVRFRKTGRKDIADAFAYHLDLCPINFEFKDTTEDRKVGLTALYHEEIKKLNTRPDQDEDDGEITPFGEYNPQDSKGDQVDSVITAPTQ
jgi:hypothetical protein